MPIHKATRNIFFIRHGESESNVLDLAAGYNYDAPLTEKGRLQAKSIINCDERSINIERSIKQLYSKKFKEKIKKSKNFYFKKNTSKNIVNILGNFPLKNLIKKFYESSKIKRI